MYYPFTLERDDNDSFLVSFPDFPEAHTFGDTRDKAIEHAADALATVLDAYIKDRRRIPAWRHERGRGLWVEVPALVSAKVALYEAMRDQRVSKTELGRRLDVHLPQIDRLIDVRHASQVSQLEAAFRAVGKRLRFEIEDIEKPVRRRRAS